MGQIVTFYSYKGGVGRTMALANVAVILAQWNYDVLTVDWDLEAPGLDNYFADYMKKGARQKKGLLDIITGQPGDDNETSWRRCISQVRIPDIKGNLHVISSGRGDTTYFSRLSRLDLDLLYSRNGGRFFDALRDEWKKRYDFVLVDSRTGITDIGGICTVQLPDIVVLFFISNNQSFFGAIEVVQKIAQARQRLPVERLKLICLPIPSKFDTQREYEISQKWLDEFANHLGGIYADWLPSDIEPRSFLEVTKIPYIPYFSFGEKLAVMEQDSGDPAGLAYAYEGLASLVSHNLERIDLFRQNRLEYINVARTHKVRKSGRTALGGGAYLDVEIEISSEGSPIIRVIGMYVTGVDDQTDKLIQLYGENASKKNLLAALRGVKTIYTFNGGKHDIPLIKDRLKIDLAKRYRHQDLMYDCWKLNLFGGLRSIESQLRIPAEFTSYLQAADLDVATTGQPELDQALFANRDNVFLLKLLRDRLTEYSLVPEKLRSRPAESGLPESMQPLSAHKYGQAAALPERPEDIGKNYGDWHLPPIDVLDKPTEATWDEEAVDERARLIEQALASYGVDAKVVQTHVGPTVTQFGVEPGWNRKYKEVREKGKDGSYETKLEEVSRTRVRVDRITSLANDLALALAAPSIRIEAPVPGAPVVGIEVPNAVFGSFALRSAIQSAAFQKIKARSKLAIALGKAAGEDVAAVDLTMMPHLLIAGATGSGKTACLNSVISCLLLHNSPNDVRFIVIDTKRVELVAFNGVPHLLSSVILDPDRAMKALRWLNQEMDSRYRRFTGEGVRSIEGYNKYRAPREALPYLVLLIDELADLMITAFDEVEHTLCRLAQLARTTGIHLVVATQRPSVDVITGLIKANFPARISFAVTSRADSRTILDIAGAERLLGRGDMLFMPAEATSPKRLQGSFVSDAEIERLVSFWGNQRQTPVTSVDFDQVAERSLNEQITTPLDPLLEIAKELVHERKPITASFLQRRLHIGYPRAARLMEALQQPEVMEGTAPETEEL